MEIPNNESETFQTFGLREEKVIFKSLLLKRLFLHIFCVYFSILYLKKYSWFGILHRVMDAFQKLEGHIKIPASVHP